MFKLESYITPVLLNYVGKYVKNFKAEQSQVSLWGGDATFQNLDLRLEVLNEQFDLPFIFISGHIHELSIHVPWVKITSEPIVITINTIECILKLKGDSTAEDEVNLYQRSSAESIQEHTPSGYMKSIVTKVVNNITINCNNLILKFVEEDIVLSVNIRFLSMQTVNEEWIPTFIDVNTSEMILRKVMTVEDLTLCLDRMDSSGKIDIYQDPVVYRCSMTIRWILNYQNSIINHTSITRFDLHCKKIEFSMTEQQIPMLLRLVSLLLTSQSKRSSKSGKSSISAEEIDTIDKDSVNLIPINNQGWSSWAWNTLTSFVPVDWSNDSFDVYSNNIIQTVHIGVYIDDAILTFKTMETAQETLSRKSVKLRYRPFLTLRLASTMASVIIQGITSTTVQLGFASIRLFPRGNCNCGHPEVRSNVESDPYISVGTRDTMNYLQNSLFRENINQNNDEMFNQPDTCGRLSSEKQITELLKIFPAFLMNYFHCVELPEEVSDKELQKLGGNFEFSNFLELNQAHYIIGDLTIKVCSGMLHRISAVLRAVENDISNWYDTPDKPDILKNELPPVTCEEFDALNEYIPTVEKILKVYKLIIHVHVADHHENIGKIQSEEMKKLRTALLDYPKVVIEVDKIICRMTLPLYAFRLVACASKQLILPQEMLSHCYKKVEINCTALSSRLQLAHNCQMLLVMPCTFEINTALLLYPQYWVNSKLTHSKSDFKLDSLTFTTTKAKLMVVHSIITSIIFPESMVANPIVNSSLFSDASLEDDPVHLELVCESLCYSNCVTSMTITKTLSVNSIRIFVLNDVNQAFVLSGPESSASINEDKLFLGVLQLPADLDDESAALIATFHLAETHTSLDPLLFRWMDYQNLNYNWHESYLWSDHHETEETSSDTSTKKKFPSLNENVHSPSDIKKSKWTALDWNRTVNAKSLNVSKPKSNVCRKFINGFSLWKRLVISGNIDPFIIYLPDTTMNGIGIHQINQAKDRALAENDSLNIIEIKTSSMVIRSASLSDHSTAYVNPITTIQLTTWNKLNDFPWVINLTELRCCTLRKQETLNFLIIQSLNATIDATIKPHINNENSSSALSFCIYIDTSPIMISSTEHQSQLIERICSNVWTVIDRSLNTKGKNLSALGNDRVSMQSQTALTSTQLLCTDTDTTSITSTSKNELDTDAVENAVVDMTAWIQWTIAKISLELVASSPQDSSQSRIVMDLEDIITSLDWQSVYLQMKHKITAATIFHYKRSNLWDHWTTGDYMGYILGSREENLEKNREYDFLNVTVTRARSNNVYTKWRSHAQQKLQKEYLLAEDYSGAAINYITEIVIKMQTLEIILPTDILENFGFVSNFFMKKDRAVSGDVSTKNCEIPLMYLDFQGLKLVIPVVLSSDCRHDTVILKVDGISAVPHAENPICRVIHRPDIYELAAQANILNTPGSAVEDRQYQIKINGICVFSTTWQNYELTVAKRQAQSLYTMNENPALEWNKVGINNTDNQSASCQFVSPFDMCCIIAPPIIFKSDVVVCGSAVEVTFLTDIEILMNLKQLELLSVLQRQFYNLNLSLHTSQSPSWHQAHGDKSAATKNVQAEVLQMSSFRGSVKDSGIDMSSTDTALPHVSRIKTSTLPFEHLVNCGKILLIFYETVETNESVVSIPLISLTLNQPNAYLSEQNLTRTLRINCFDVAIGLADDEKYHEATMFSNATNFKSYLVVETKNGDPHPNTGIPPSFLIVKWEKISSEKCLFSMEIGRPTKINLSSSIISQITTIMQKISKSFSSSEIKQPEEKTSYQNWLVNDQKINIPDIDLTTKQVVLLFRMDPDTEIVGSFTEFWTSVSSKPRKIHANVTMNSFMVTTKVDGSLRPLLKPTSCNLIANVIWESWKELDSIPQLRIQIFSDGIRFEIEQSQVQLLYDIHKYFKDELDCSSDTSTTNEMKRTLTPSVTEQHYQDDLKTGAFQFADGFFDQVPMPYQVLFYSSPCQIMAWRYPQPRILTRLCITPVLMEIMEDADVDLNSVKCVVEYWNESLMAYQQYIEFTLGDMDYSSKLPHKSPTRAVACLWRAILCPLNDDEESLVSARDLAGCLRIDSFFNSSLIPMIEVTLSTQLIQLSLMNRINMKGRDLPKPLHVFKLNNCFPISSNFACVSGQEMIFIYNQWQSHAYFIEFAFKLDASILDYRTMVMQEIVEPLENKVQMSNKDDQTHICLMCKALRLKFGPEVAQTLSLLVNTWTLSRINSCEQRHDIFTGLVVANDSIIPIRFGQCLTTDDIMLQSRECHFYYWRYRCSEKMRIAVNNNGWSWSRPFDVSQPGITSAVFDRPDSPQIIVTVKLLSAVQKLISFSGRIVISNQLIDNFELKLIRYNVECDHRVIVSENLLNIGGHKQSPSLVVEDQKNLALRLRFADLSNSAWTGDIPLYSNVKCDQPWLVKVPTTEKSRFFSIWVRIVEEKLCQTERILVILSPLYVIQSWLPMPIDITVKTPMMGDSITSFDEHIAGCGQLQQIHCPGTFEHVHQIIFPFTISASVSSCAPMSYNQIDQRTFFKRPDNEDIEVILKQLADQKASKTWSFYHEDLDTWTPIASPQTHIQVKYRDAGLVSSTLLMEVHPWCLIFNASGQTLSLLTSENDSLCEIPYGGVVAPCKIDGIFHIQLSSHDGTHKSSPLQLASSDWNQGFMMPQINGLIPLEGTVHAAIDCGRTSTFLIIKSTKHNEHTRTLKIMSTHVVCNFTNHHFKIAPIVINTTVANVELPSALENFKILPCRERNTGTPILQWQKVSNSPNNSGHFISICSDDADNNYTSWSCPVKVDQLISRHCVAISDGTTTIPIVVITQKENDISYVTIYDDSHPQFVIKNSCSIPVIVGHPNRAANAIEPDASPFSWMCEIESGQSSHYTMNNFTCRIPDALIDKHTVSALMIGTYSKSDDTKICRWIKIIEFPAEKPFKFDQFVYVDGHGDVKIMIETLGHTIYIYLETKSQAEVSVRDIRSRLMSEGTKIHQQKFPSPSDSVTQTPSYFETNQSGTSKQILIEEQTNTNETYAVHLTFYFHMVSLIITQDGEDNTKPSMEVAGLYLTNTIVNIISSPQASTIKISIDDLQLDNQMFDCGGFDFAVVLISQSPPTSNRMIFNLSSHSLESITKEIAKSSLIALEGNWDKVNGVLICKNIHVKLSPINIYIEDKFISQLLEYTSAIIRPSPLTQADLKYSISTDKIHINVPGNIVIDANIMSVPLQLHRLTIEPISLLLSVHTSVRLYVALDHSPLHFGIFQRSNLFTTPYRLGNALTMHYLSGAIFGAGWVVGSLEILGSPGSFAQALGSGLKDFIALPFQGLLQGPWEFIVGITHGSASLMKNITAGTVNSVTKLASSVARNLDRLTLDEEHLQRQENSRRNRPQGMVQGLYQGLTGFGISILAAVAGLAHHPLQHVWSGEATTRGVVTGVGLGLVGVVTKPLSGAAELVALTGQGLLSRTGWNSLPKSRRVPDPITVIRASMSNRYVWKLIPYLTKNHDDIVHLVDGVFASNRTPVTILVTRQNFVVIDNNEDSVDRILSLREISFQTDSNDATLFRLTVQQFVRQTERSSSPEKSEMDEEMRSRVKQYVLNSGSGYVTNSSDECSAQLNSPSGLDSNIIAFFIDPHQRNYLMNILRIIKRQNQGLDFTVF